MQWIFSGRGNWHFCMGRSRKKHDVAVQPFQIQRLASLNGG